MVSGAGPCISSITQTLMGQHWLEWNTTLKEWFTRATAEKRHLPKEGPLVRSLLEALPIHLTRRLRREYFTVGWINLYQDVMACHHFTIQTRYPSLTVWPQGFCITPLVGPHPPEKTRSRMCRGTPKSSMSVMAFRRSPTGLSTITPVVRIPWLSHQNDDLSNAYMSIKSRLVGWVGVLRPVGI